MDERPRRRHAAPCRVVRRSIELRSVPPCGDSFIERGSFRDRPRWQQARLGPAGVARARCATQPPAPAAAAGTSAARRARPPRPRARRAPPRRRSAPAALSTASRADQPAASSAPPAAEHFRSNPTAPSARHRAPTDSPAWLMLKCANPGACGLPRQGNAAPSPATARPARRAAQPRASSELPPSVCVCASGWPARRMRRP